MPIPSTASKRLTFMADARLLQRTTNLRWAGSVLWPTAAGMRAAGLNEGLAPLGAPEMPTDERMGHRLLLVDWAIQHAAGFDQIVTEREFLTVERGGNPEVAERFVMQLGVRAPGVRGLMGRPRWFGFPLAGGTGLHFPDVFGVSGGGLRAIEVEVSPKNPARVKQTLCGSAGVPGRAAAGRGLVCDTGGAGHVRGVSGVGREVAGRFARRCWVRHGGAGAGLVDPR